MGWFTLEFVVRFVSSPSKVTPSLEIMVTSTDECLGPVCFQSDELDRLHSSDALLRQLGVLQVGARRKSALSLTIPMYLVLISFGNFSTLVL